ncbi:MAG: serine hydrolase [Acidobacteria bacterium]|nr:serine hydrolase [Acidobacteriota bacterium]
MRRLLSLLLVLSFSAFAAEPLPLAKPETVGMSAERLGRIGDWVDGMIQRKQAAGFVTLVARRGKVVHYETSGTLGLSVNQPMPEDALFDIASMTKPVTVVAALMLLEEGRFTMDDPISRYLPEFKNMRVQVPQLGTAPAESEITVRHAFTHTTGVGANWPVTKRYEFATFREYMQEMAKVPLVYQPGSTWLYGDSLDVLGYLVETVSGQPLGDFVQQRILDPLGMGDTHYWIPKSKESRRAVLNVRGQDDLEGTSRRPLEAVKRASLVMGASGLYSTAADYWRFSQMLVNGGELNGKRLLGPRTVGWIAEDHLGDAKKFDRAGQTFGLGHAVTVDPGGQSWYYSRGSYFWSGSQGTVFWVDPKEELVGVLMVQVSGVPGLSLREKFAGLVYGAIVD